MASENKAVLTEETVRAQETYRAAFRSFFGNEIPVPDPSATIKAIEANKRTPVLRTEADDTDGGFELPEELQKLITDQYEGTNYIVATISLTPHLGIVTVQPLLREDEITVGSEKFIRTPSDQIGVRPDMYFDFDNAILQSGVHILQPYYRNTYGGFIDVPIQWKETPLEPTVIDNFSGLISPLASREGAKVEIAKVSPPTI